MIVRTWRGRTPIAQAEAFTEHLMATGVADYRAQPGCREVRLWRQARDGWTWFTLVSLWTDMAAIAAYAGEEPSRAVLYPGDERFGLVPDLEVEHHELIAAEPPVVP